MEDIAVCLILSLLRKLQLSKIIKLEFWRVQFCNDKIQHPKSATTVLAKRIGIEEVERQKEVPPFRKAAFLLLFARQKVGQKEGDKYSAK